MPWYFRIEISEASGQADRDNGEADPPALSLPGARLWCDRQPLALGGHGYLIGHLFERGEMSRRVLDLHETAVTRMAASSGRSLVSRSAERRVGKECVSTCRSRWSPYI